MRAAAGKARRKVRASSSSFVGICQDWFKNPMLSSDMLHRSSERYQDAVLIRSHSGRSSKLLTFATRDPVRFAAATFVRLDFAARAASNDSVMASSAVTVERGFI
jgi:hypothetical protein